MHFKGNELMKLVISNLILSLDGPQEALKQQAAKKLGIKHQNITNFKIVKQSIDARKKPGIRLVYSISCEVDDCFQIPGDRDIKILADSREEILLPGSKPVEGRPLVIGTGPAGLFLRSGAGSERLQANNNRARTKG